VARKVVVEGKAFSEEITPEKVTEYLGVPRFRNTMAEETNEIGVATGLAWTEVGGEILVTEATLMPGKGHLTLTGKLGDVMQESAQAAMSYVRSKAEEFGIEKDFNKRTDVHIHVPEGAIPKDGPSAGITLATALVSALSRNPIRKDVAMTGEITLRGKVLPIGGIKEKVLGAHRAGLRRVLMPSHNEADLDDIPADLRKQMQFVLLESIDQLLREALMSKRQVALNGGNGVRTTVVARAAGSSRARPAPAHRRGAKGGRRRPVA
jgi:ATP-dependent Lon protease